MCKLVHLLLALVLFTGAVSSAFESHKLSSVTVSTESNQYLVQDDGNGLFNDHSHCECSCPVHQLGCCHSANAFVEVNGVLLTQLPDSVIYSEKSDHLKAGPYLDGPYQPPRI